MMCWTKESQSRESHLTNGSTSAAHCQNCTTRCGKCLLLALAHTVFTPALALTLLALTMFTLILTKLTRTLLTLTMTTLTMFKLSGMCLSLCYLAILLKAFALALMRSQLQKLSPLPIHASLHQYTFLQCLLP